MSDKLMDWAGESVDKDSCPLCTKHPDCFACVEGYCTALSMIWRLFGSLLQRRAIRREAQLLKRYGRSSTLKELIIWIM